MDEDGSARGGAWPLPRSCFDVDFGDGRPHGFAEISGLESDIKPVEYRHGDSEVFATIKMPGLRSVGNVTLKKGVIPQDSTFWDWLDQARLNVIKRRSVTIRLLDGAGEPKMVWTLTNAWPLRMTGTDLSPDSREVAVETLELAYETLIVKAI